MLDEFFIALLIFLIIMDYLIDASYILLGGIVATLPVFILGLVLKQQDEV